MRTKPKLKINSDVFDRFKRIAEIAGIPAARQDQVAAHDAAVYSFFDDWFARDSVRKINDTTLSVTGVIDDSTYDQLVDFLRDGEIDTIKVNSEGGMATVGIACYHLIREANVRVEVEGMAFSAASDIAVAGSPLVIKRGSTIGIHRPWVLAVGNADELREVADFMDTMSEAMFEIYSARVKGKKKLAELRELYMKDSLLTGEEAVRIGLADEYEGGEAESKGGKKSARMERVLDAMARRTPEGIEEAAELLDEARAEIDADADAEPAEPKKAQALKDFDWERVFSIETGEPAEAASEGTVILDCEVTGVKANGDAEVEGALDDVEPGPHGGIVLTDSDAGYAFDHCVTDADGDTRRISESKRRAEEWTAGDDADVESMIASIAQQEARPSGERGETYADFRFSVIQGK